ncbi:hypothetical protein B0T22DRAFT_299643 [Podospora appendiculata]|uniref:Uncharacterized protein n=1 Tax=Podospora appendiculata TaxID=314037 RepID=A0AAE1C7L6_9PEZI|nr:hypothetical protein B0T22DRAFT_299643 [Podospora appendiculata]
MKLSIALLASVAAAAPARNMMLNWAHAMNLTGTNSEPAAHLSARSTNMMMPAAHTVNMPAMYAAWGSEATMHAARAFNFTHIGTVKAHAVDGAMLNTTTASTMNINTLNSTSSLTRATAEDSEATAVTPSTTESDSAASAAAADALVAQIKAKLNMLNETEVVWHVVDMVLEEVVSAAVESRAVN